MNEFNEIRKLEQEKEMSNNIKILVEEVRKVNEALIEVKKTQTIIRQDLRNLDKLRPLKNTVEE